MRARLAFVLLGVLWTGEAAASSFIVLAPSEDAGGPSVVTLGEPRSTASVTTLLPPDGATDPAVTIGEVEQPGKAYPADSGIITVSSSIVAMGEPEVAAQEKVSAIGGDSRKPQFDRLPIVIRGGVVGDAFSPAAVGGPVPLTPEPDGPDQQASGAAPPQSQPKKPVEQAPEPQPQEPEQSPLLREPE